VGNAIKFVPQESGANSQVPKQGPPKKLKVDSDEEDEATTDNELELKKKEEIL